MEAKIDKAELTTNLADKTQEQGDDKQLKINSIKKLYHGTNKLFDSVDLNRCGRFKDFGQGYYLTTDLKQAQKWAQYKAEDATEAYIYSYNVISPVEKKLRILELLEYNKEWVDVISKSRIWGIEPQYDIVYDRIADNRRSEIAMVLQKYVAKDTDADSVIEMIQWKNGTGDQYCFKTADALSVLGNERRFILHKDNNGRWRKPVELKDDGRDE